MRTTDGHMLDDGDEDDYIPTCRDCGAEICADQMDVGLCVDCETGRPGRDAGIGHHMAHLSRNSGRR